MGKAAREARRARQRAERTRMRIVIGAVSSTLSLEREMRLIIPALIYGDEVLLYSPVASALADFSRLAKSGDMSSLVAKVAPFAAAAAEAQGQELDTSMLAYLPLIERLAEVSDSDVDALLTLVPERDRPSALEALTKVRESLGQLDDSRAEMEHVIDTMARDARLPELSNAISAGALRIEHVDFDSSSDAAVAAFVLQIAGHFNNPGAHILVDDLVGGVLTAALHENDRTGRRSRQVSVGTSLLGMVPSFDHITVAEAIDVRTELSPAVVRFRSAVGKFERELAASAPASPELEADIVALWHDIVAPELEDLRGRIDDNRSLRLLQGGAATSARDVATPFVSGAIGMAAGSFAHVQPALVAALGILAPLAAKQRLESIDIRRHRLYLLHAVQCRAQRSA